MIKVSGMVILAGLVLTGCTANKPAHNVVSSPVAMSQQQDQKARQPAPVPASVSNDSKGVFSAAQPTPDKVTNSSNPRIQQCRKELDAMRLYSKASYDKYQAEFISVASKTNKYWQIKDSIGADINDLAVPRYQFRIRELCFRIKNRLSQLIIHQMQ